MKFHNVIYFSACFFSGCQEPSDQDISSWIKKNQVISSTSTSQLISEEKFPPFIYEAKERVDPFDAQKISVLFSTIPSAGNIYAPYTHRVKEMLEHYSIESLKMVGTLRRSGKTVALIEAEKIIYPVQIGNYLGQDMGRIIKISESEMQIEEVVQDASGEWSKRVVELKMRDK